MHPMQEQPTKSRDVTVHRDSLRLQKTFQQTESWKSAADFNNIQTVCTKWTHKKLKQGQQAHMLW